MAFYGKRQPLTDFYSQLKTIFSGAAWKGYTFDYLPFEQDQFVRVQAQRAGKGGPLAFDLTPGPPTPWGPSVGLRSRRGSERIFGSEINWPSEEAGPTFHQPYENIQRYIKGAFDPQVLGLPAVGGKAQRGLEHLVSKGYGKLGLAGGLMNIGSSDPPWAQIDVASQVAVSLGGGMQPEAAFQGIAQRSTSPNSAQEWHRMQNLGPWRSSQDMLRLRRYGTLVRGGEEGAWDWSVYGLGKAADEHLKRLPISMSLRQEATAFGMEEGGMMERQPQNITSMGDRAGLRWLNMLMPGETQPRAAMVQPNMYFTPGTPFSGSMSLYRSAAHETGIDAFGYGQTESFEMQLPHMQDLESAKFQFGVMKQNAEGAWEKIRSLTGFTLGAGRSATIGTYQVGETTHPLRVSAGGTPMMFGGPPSMDVSKFYNIESGKGTSGLGYNPRIHQSLALDQIQQQFTAGGGGEVSQRSSGPAYLDFPVAAQTDVSFKGMGMKAMPYEAMGVAQLFKDDPVVSRFSGVTGELKNPLVGFMAQLGALPLPQLSKAFGEFGGEMGRQMQMSFATRGTAKVDPEQMAQTYSHFRGKDYQPQHTVYQMFEELQGIHRGLDPMQSMQQYGMAHFSQEEAPWLPLGFKTRGERQLYTERGLEGIALATEGKVTGLAAHRMLREKLQFKPVYAGAEGGAPTFQAQGKPIGYMYMMKGGGFAGTAVSPIVPEFRARAPLWSQAEQSAISMTFPEEARSLGLHTEQAYGATGVTPEFQRGWRQVGDIARHQASGRGMIPEDTITITEDIRRQIKRDLFAEGAQPSIGTLSKYFAENISGGTAPLHDPMTGELLEHPAMVEATTAFKFRDPETGEALNFEAKKYGAALAGLLAGETRQTTGGALGEISARREAIFQSQSRTAMKLVQGRFAPSIGGRFSFFSGGDIGDQYLSTERSEYLGRQSGVKSMSGRPVLRQRFPALSPEHQLQPGRVVTPKSIMEQFKIDYGTFPESSMGQGTISSDIGDYDADYQAMLSLAGVDPKSGKPISKAQRGVQSILDMDYKERISRENQALTDIAGEQYGVPGGKYNVVAQAISDMFTKPEWAESYYTASSTMENLQFGLQRAGAKAEMGRVHNLATGMEVAAGVLGASPARVASLRTSMAISYQQPLDQEAWSNTALGRIVQSSILTTNRTGTEAQMMAIGAAGGKHSEFWSSRSGILPFQVEYGDVLARAVEGDMARGRITPEAAGHMFAMPNMAPEKLTQQIKEQGANALYGLMGQEGYNVLRTPVGLHAFTQMMGRTFGTAAREARTIDTDAGKRNIMEIAKASQIPINLGFGEIGPITQLQGMPAVQQQESLYLSATRRGGLPQISRGSMLAQELHRRRQAGDPTVGRMEQVVMQHGLGRDPKTELDQAMMLSSMRGPIGSGSSVGVGPTTVNDPNFIMGPQAGRFPTMIPKTRQEKIDNMAVRMASQEQAYRAQRSSAGDTGVTPRGGGTAGEWFTRAGDFYDDREGWEAGLGRGVALGFEEMKRAEFSGPQRSTAEHMQRFRRGYSLIRGLEGDEKYSSFYSRAVGMVSKITGRPMSEVGASTAAFDEFLGDALALDRNQVQSFFRETGIKGQITGLTKQGKVLTAALRSSAKLGSLAADPDTALGKQVQELGVVAAGADTGKLGMSIYAAEQLGAIGGAQEWMKGPSGVGPVGMKQAGEALNDFTKAIRDADKASKDYTDGTIKRTEYEKQMADAGRRAGVAATTRAEIFARGEYGVAQGKLAFGQMMGAGPEELTDLRNQAAIAQEKLFKTSQARRAADAPPPSMMARVTGGMRRAISGWGLMYMSRMLQLGLGPLQQGYPEYQQYMQQQQQAASQMYGPGEITPFVSPEQQRQKALIRAGGVAYGGLRGLGTAIMGTPISDVGASAMAGIGAMGIYSHLAGAMGVGAEAIGAAAGPIGLVAAGAVLLGQGIGYATQPQQTMMSAAAQGAGDTALGEITQAWRSWWLGPKGMADTNRLERQVEQLASGQVPQGLSDREKALVAQTFGATTIKGLEHLDSNIQGRIALWTIESGRPTTVQEMARLGEAMQNGIPIQAIATQISRYMGVPAQGATAYFDSMVDITSGLGEDEQASLTAGLSLMQKTPGVRGLARDMMNLYQFGGPAPSRPPAYGGPIGRATAIEVLRKSTEIAWQAHGQGPRRTEEELLTAIAEEQFGRIEGGAYEGAFLQRAGLIERQRALGMPQAPMDWSQYYADTATWTPERRAREGLTTMTGMAGVNMQERLLAMGATTAQIGDLPAQFQAMGMGGMGLANQIMGMDPTITTGLAMGGAYGNLEFQGMQMNMLAGTMDIRGGMQTGLPWGTTGMQRGNVPGVVMGLRTFGMDAFKGQGTGAQAARAATFGLGETFMGRDVPEYMQGRGAMQGLQWIQSQIQRDSARAAAGNQMAMLELQGRYQPQFWAIQDQQRALSHEQAQWGFQMQERQFEMAGTQFYENLGLQRYGQVQQRGWRREDWAMQDQMRSMQWGWKQEDFQENVRFMTGRQRRQAETGMERETVMFNLQGQQIETQRERQAEIWRLEDERYQLTIQHFEESRDLQAENMTKQQEYYFEGKRLQDEMIALQREYWKEMHALQLAAAGAQASYAEQMYEVQDLMTQLGTEQKDLNGLWRVAQSDSDLMINSIIRGLNYVTARAPASLRSIIDALQGGDVVLIDPVDTGGGSGGDGGGNGCFVAGTMILMANGNSIAIEDITLGDKVITFSEDNEFSEGEVKWVMEPTEKTVYVLNDNIEVSGEHPFWTPDGWVKATDLASGDRYYTFDGIGIRLEELTSVWYSPTAVTVYNFHVEGDETYIADGAMVHNKVMEDPGSTFVPSVASNGGNGDTKIIVMIGNEKLEEYVIKTVKNDLEHA